MTTEAKPFKDRFVDDKKELDRYVIEHLRRKIIEKEKKETKNA